MIESIFSVLAKSGLWFLDMWIKRNTKNKDMVDSYYNFLKQVDQAGALKVANYLLAEDALKAKQEELKKELLGGK